MNDVSKRMAIKEILGFDVNAAVAHNVEANTTETADSAAPKRRVVQKAPTAEPARRSEPPKYKVVNPKE